MSFIQILRDADERSMNVHTFDLNDPVQVVVRRLLQARGEQTTPGSELFDVTVFGADEEFVRVWFIAAYQFSVFSFTRKDVDALCA